MASWGTNLAPTDGERTNNKKKKTKEEFLNKAEKDQSLQSLLKDVKGVREQAEIHRVIYTPLGQKYYHGDPDLSRGYYHQGIKAPHLVQAKRRQNSHSAPFIRQAPRMAERKCPLHPR